LRLHVMHIHMYKYIYAYIHTHMYICIHTYLYIYKYTFTSTYTYTRTCIYTDKAHHLPLPALSEGGARTFIVNKYCFMHVYFLVYIYPYIYVYIHRQRASLALARVVSRRRPKFLRTGTFPGLYTILRIHTFFRTCTLVRIYIYLYIYIYSYTDIYTDNAPHLPLPALSEEGAPSFFIRAYIFVYIHCFLHIYCLVQVYFSEYIYLYIYVHIHTQRASPALVHFVRTRQMPRNI